MDTERGSQRKIALEQIIFSREARGASKMLHWLVNSVDIQKQNKMLVNSYVLKVSFPSFACFCLFSFVLVAITVYLG